jgi:hypothetical protein
VIHTVLYRLRAEWNTTVMESSAAHIETPVSHKNQHQLQVPCLPPSFSFRLRLFRIPSQSFVSGQIAYNYCLLSPLVRGLGRRKNATVFFLRPNPFPFHPASTTRKPNYHIPIQRLWGLQYATTRKKLVFSVKSTNSDQMGVESSHRDLC